MDKEQLAIQRLRDAGMMAQRANMGPLYVLDSGGKDSTVIADLAIKAKVPIEIVHSHTTADAPETVYFVRREMARFEAMGLQCTVEKPTYKGRSISMWTLIPQKLIPPTRTRRYCCDVLKEVHGTRRMCVTGVRWAESARRKNSRGIFETLPHDMKKKIILNNDNDEKRREFEVCTTKGKRVCNPIVDWADDDVWDYIHAYKLPYNPLYDEGCKRVGCVGCPMAGKRRTWEFARWPKYEQMYIAAFDRMLEERARLGKMQGTWYAGTTGREVFHWWMEDGVLPGQMEMEEMLNDN